MGYRDSTIVPTFCVGCDPSIKACMGSMCPLSPFDVCLVRVMGLVVPVGVGGVGGTCLCRHSRLFRTAAVHTENCKKHV